MYHIEGAVFTTIWCSMYKVQSVDSRNSFSAFLLYMNIYIFIHIYECIYKLVLVSAAVILPSVPTRAKFNAKKFSEIYFAKSNNLGFQGIHK